MLPVIVRPVRVVMQGLIAIMTLGVLEVRANPCHARSRTDGPMNHSQSEEYDDNLGACWADRDHGTEYSTAFRSARLEHSFHAKFPHLLAKRIESVLLKFFWKGQQFTRIP